MGFYGKETKEKLAQLQEGLDSQVSELLKLARVVEDKVDKVTFQKQTEQISAESAKKVEVVSITSEGKTSALQDRASTLEQAADKLLALVAEKASASSVQNQEREFLARFAEMDKRLEGIMSVLAEKSTIIQAERQQQLLAHLDERILPLERYREHLIALLPTKSDVSQFHKHCEDTASKLSALDHWCSQLAAEVASKADTVFNDRQHQDTSSKLQSHVDRLELDLKKVRSDLACRLDGMQSEWQERHNSHHRHLQEIEEVESRRHNELLSSLAEKDKAINQNMPYTREEMVTMFADKQATQSVGQHHQEQLDAIKSLIRRQRNEITVELATKTDLTLFEQQGEQVNASKACIEVQREQLQHALVKKDRLVALCEQIQVDLSLALSFKGRGPHHRRFNLAPVEPPGSGKLKTPQPSPRPLSSG